uniref:dolichol kinase n=1 Tax=Meloidogyne hapla TaxID=6305 RepID=A0A1I8BBF5_MELHA
MNTEFKPYNDKALIAISWIATCSFVAATLIRKRRLPNKSSIIVNLYMVGTVFAAYFLFACLLGHGLKGTFLILWLRVFDGTYKRLCLLLFWLLCAIESILFSIMVNCRQRKANTTHRKFFHLTISLIMISGLYNDPLFLALSGHLMLQIFIIIEIFRNQRIEPWSDFLDQMFLIFVDGQDSKDLILTPIFLLAGMFLPLFLDATLLYSPHWTLKQRHFSGVLSVGVGDSFAAIVGSRFGRVPWPFVIRNKCRKTIEGSIAMFFTQIIASEIIFGFCSLSPSLILSALVSTIAEAHLNFGDNLFIPFCSAITFYLFE